MKDGGSAQKAASQGRQDIFRNRILRALISEEQSRWNMKKVKDHPKWPWSVFKMTYKNDEGGTEDFRVQTNDYTLVFHYTEK